MRFCNRVASNRQDLRAARCGGRWAAQAYRAAAEAGDTLADTLMKELLRDVGAAAGALRQQQDVLPDAQVHPPSLLRRPRSCTDASSVRACVFGTRHGALLSCIRAGRKEGARLCAALIDTVHAGKGLQEQCS